MSAATMIFQNRPHSLFSAAPATAIHAGVPATLRRLAAGRIAGDA